MNPGSGIPHSLYNPRQVPSSLWPQFPCLGAMGVPRASELTWGWLRLGCLRLSPWEMGPVSCSWPACSKDICCPDQRTACPSSTLAPLPSPKLTKLIVLGSPVGAGWAAGRRPQAEVPPARAPPDTQGIVPQSTAPGHLSPAPEAASVSPGKMLVIQIPRCHPRPIQSHTLECRGSNPCLNQAPR